MATIGLPSGVLGFDPNRFQSGNVYIAHPDGTTIRNSSSSAYSYAAQIKDKSDILIRGVRFDDNGVELGRTNRITFEDCHFTDARRTRDNHQAIFGAGNNSLTLRRCHWLNCSQVIQLYGGNGTLVEDCRFKNSGYGYKHGMNGGRNLVIRRCVFDGMRATMGCEIQNDSEAIDSILVEDCAYVNPELYADDSRNGNAMAFSFPLAKATNIIGRRNYADGLAWVIDGNGNRTSERRASRRVDGVRWAGLRIGCEVGGTNPKWYQNWMVNLNDPGAITTSAQAECYDNRVERCLESWNAASGAQSIKRLENNGPGVPLPEFGGWSLVGVSSGGSSPPPIDPPPPPPPPPADIAELQRRIAELEQQLATATGNVSALRAERDTLAAKLAAIKQAGGW